MMWAQASLQQRLLWGLLGTLVGLWSLALALTWRSVQHELDELLDAHLAQSAALLEAHESREPRHRHHREVDQVTARVNAAPPHHEARPVAFQVWREGVLVLRSANVPETVLSDRANGFQTLMLNGEPWRLFASQDVDDELHILVAERMAARQDILRAVLYGMLGPLLLGLPVIGLAVWWVVRRGLAPLKGVVDALETRQPNTLDALIVPEPLPADIQPLVQALNDLFGRIALLLEGERRFTADAAHELRTPIAAIRTQAQVAIGAQNDAERRHALLATVSGCDRASHLVQQLLTLSRLEAQGAVGPALCDVHAIAQRVAADLALEALSRQQTLSLEGAGPCHVPGDDALLGILLRNLLDNALRYSPAGASVEVCVNVEATGISVCVEDSGPGLTPAELARLGERFFRVLGRGVDGSGLGWSIVRRIASVHRAQVAVSRSDRLGGLRVDVHFTAS